MLISAADGAALAFFGGLREKARAAAACVGFATTGSREPEDGYIPVFIVIMCSFWTFLGLFRAADAARALQCRE